jgi:hypothetical protein
MKQQYLISQKPRSMRYCTPRTAMQLSQQKDHAHRTAVHNLAALRYGTYCIPVHRTAATSSQQAVLYTLHKMQRFASEVTVHIAQQYISSQHEVPNGTTYGTHRTAVHILVAGGYVSIQQEAPST